jgi:Leucine-rich repeat (LRR) protein
VKQLPHLDTSTALQTLYLYGSKQLQQLPPLATLAVLQTLYLDNCGQLQLLPPLSTLASMQTLAGCVQLQTLLPLGTLSMLQWKRLRGCESIHRGCVRLPCTQSSEDDGVSAEKLQDLEAEHVESLLFYHPG